MIRKQVLDDQHAIAFSVGENVTIILFVANTSINMI